MYLSAEMAVMKEAAEMAVMKEAAERMRDKNSQKMKAVAIMMKKMCKMNKPTSF
jgi:hypothetical protein